MGTLTDIGYGIGKYLTASDASGIPDIGTNRKNLDLLNFKIAVNNAYTLYKFKDGMIDSYQDESGVDTAISANESYDSTNKTYGPVVTAAAVTAFTSNGAATWTCPAGITSANILVVAGAGGGGDAGTGASGAGGAGGIVHHATYTTVPAVVYDLVVGDGGENGTGGFPPGYDGDDSVWNVNAEGSGLTMTADGGGGGGQDGEPGRDGGSGGGEGADEAVDAPGEATQGNSGGGTGYGNDGGNGFNEQGAGGGGASAVGEDSSSGDAGNGGAGKLFAGFEAYGTTSGNAASSGSDGGYFGGGGGGGSNTATADVGTGGVGGGATGVYDPPGNQKPDALDNTGGGGGGGGAGPGYTGYGGTGGSGVVLIKTAAVTNNMTLESFPQTAQSVPTEGRLIIYEEDVDLISPGTDIKGYVSRDNGTTWSSAVGLTQDTVYTVGGIDSYTKLMLHCDGANDGTTFTDSSISAHSVTATNAVTKTAIKKFGTASGYFDGTGDKLVIPSSSDFGFGTGDFTIDWWFYLDDTGTDPHIFDSRNDGEQVLYFDTSDSYKLVYYTSNSPGSGVKITSSSAPTPDTWIHFALVRSSGTTTMYFDGTSVGSFSDSIDYPAGGLTIGDYVGGSFEYTGYMDEIRISKGIARWTANFTPEGSAYEVTKRLLAGSIDISGQPSGTDMKYKVETLNDKNLKLHGASLLWA